MRRTFLTGVTLCSVMFFQACEREYLQRPEVPKPKVPVQTTVLEAGYTVSPPKTANASYWNSADFFKVTLKDISTKNLYTEDGHLNMSGTYNGLSDFNNKGAEDLIMKAAYDDEHIYILVEWTDFKSDAFRSSWLYHGEKDPNKTDSNGNWTSQRNDDKMALVFNGQAATGSAGTFDNAGCAVTCHSGSKKTQNGIADLWKWSLLETETFGYAANLSVTNTEGLSNDAGTKKLVRNAQDSASYRSGPMYEWNGIKQEVTKADGSINVLDPQYFLLNKIAFEGDAVKGAKIYIDENKGCSHCHGEDGHGHGDYGSAPAFTSPFFNTYTREFFDERALDPAHTGRTYYEKVKAAEKDDLMARIRGFSGVPGYFFSTDVMTDQDIQTSSNVVMPKINEKNTTYKVLMIRKLNSGKDGDVVFDPESNASYPFGVALMDADGKNHIGSLLETLTFIEK